MSDVTFNIFLSMQDFRTIYTPQQSDLEIDYLSKIFIMGSCFAQEIGHKLRAARFDLNESPFGIVYNPMSIFQQIERILTGRQYHSDELVYFNKLYHSLDHHGQYSGIDKDEVLSRMNTEIDAANLQLKKSNLLILSFGSAYYYKYLQSDQVVSNCHKIPNSEFTKILATQEEINIGASKALTQLRVQNPNLKIIVTVSPVRYLRDGFIGNSRSKARLFALSELLETEFNQLEYFPSYELLMDDLRDYRFYADDMLHPSSQAIDYIWDVFGKTYFSKNTFLAIEKINQYNNFVNHRILHHTHESVESRNEKIRKLKEDLLIEFPFLEERL